jgi:hypothetical protein
MQAGHKRAAARGIVSPVRSATCERAHGRHKLLKWWAQSFLVGIETVVCGLRDGDGVVQRIEELPVN